MAALAYLGSAATLLANNGAGSTALFLVAATPLLVIAYRLVMVRLEVGDEGLVVHNVFETVDVDHEDLVGAQFSVPSISRFGLRPITRASLQLPRTKRRIQISAVSAPRALTDAPDGMDRAILALEHLGVSCTPTNNAR